MINFYFGRAPSYYHKGQSLAMRDLCQDTLGVRPTLNGLLIAPAVDPAWKEFSTTRTYRGAKYAIHFTNPEGVESGTKEIWLDGKQIEGNLLPLPTAAKHEVEVITGRA
jgi:cellobiose phosphorylase